jgi:hypothetical protein
MFFPWLLCHRPPTMLLLFTSTNSCLLNLSTTEGYNNQGGQLEAPDAGAVWYHTLTMNNKCFGWTTNARMLNRRTINNMFSKSFAWASCVCGMLLCATGVLLLPCCVLNSMNNFRNDALSKRTAVGVVLYQLPHHI